MTTGTLRHRIRIEKSVVTRDRFGGEVQDWIPVATVWGSVESLSGGEFEVAKQRHAEVSHTIVIRYRPDITPSLRVVVKNRWFEILAVINPKERNVWLYLLCKERVTDG